MTAAPTSTGLLVGPAVAARLLGGVPLFAQLGPDRLARLAAVATPVAVRAGERLFTQGEPGTALYVVRSGRLEVLVDGRVVRVHGRGEAFGELALLTGGRRTATVRARRDSELLAVHRADIDRLIATEPAFSHALIRHLAQRTPGADPAPARRTGLVLSLVAGQPGLHPAAVPRIGALLAGELGRRTRIARFDGDGDPGGWTARLDAAEAAHDLVLLVAERPGDEWARFCLRQADRPLVVVDPARPPVTGGRGPGAPASRGPASPAPGGRRGLPTGVQLVALGTTGLRAWLDAVNPVAHHLVEADRAPEDVARMARRVTGRAIGVVLSGGGARGLAHIGVLEELVRAGVCIDRVGGTSMGSVVAGLFAVGVPPARIADMAARELVPRRLFGDVTWPRHALIRGNRVRATLESIFDGARIEDQRRSLFAVSVDLVAATEVIHRRGPIADAVALSVRIPGLAPPQRVGDRLHVDGGVLDNLPIGVMAADGEGPVIAVDVSEQFDLPQGGTGDALPRIVDTIGRAMTIGSWRRSLSERALAHTVITPDLHGLGLFDFGQFEELVERGRQAGRETLARVGGLVRP